MSSISREYHPPNCRLEITAQTSSLSRWTQRPIVKSVHFLLIFPGLSGRNHEPLEIRGNHDQLQLLSRIVADYVQHSLGQPLATVGLTAELDSLSTIAVDQTPLASQSTQPYLRPQSLVTHDLVLGSLTTNADNHSIPLQVSQLFDLVSALDDCAAELEMLPHNHPPRRRILATWVSSAAVMVVLLGVTTATLQLTRQPPSTQRDWVTSSKQSTPSKSPTTEAGGSSSAPLQSVPATPTAPTTPSQRPSQSSPRTSPWADTIGSLPKPLPERDDHRLPSSAEAKLPAKHPLASTPPQALAKAEPKGTPVPLTTPSPPSTNIPPPERASPATPPAPSFSSTDLPQVETPTHAQKSTGPSLITPAPTSKTLQTPRRPSPATVPPIIAEPSLPESADTHTAAEKGNPIVQTQDQRSLQGRQHFLDQVEQSSPASTTQADAATLQVFEIRQFMSKRWQVPVGLTQPLRYQLLFNANGSLKQINPLDKAAAQYLSQVPFPAVNQPFITPFQSSQPPRIRLVLEPDGTMQTVVDALADPMP